MMRYLLFACLAAQLLATTACNKKKDEVQPAYSRDFKVSNMLNEKVYVNVYESKDDYRRSAKAMMSITMEARSEMNTSVSTYIDSLYIDWHTDNYNYTNWGTEAQNGLYDYEYTMNQKESNIILLHSTYKKTNARKFLLNGNDADVTWSAVNCKDWNNQPIWHQLTDNEKYRIVTWSKSMQVIYQDKDTAGAVTKQRGTFSLIENGSAGYYGAKISLPSQDAIMMYNPGNPNNEDTLLLQDVKNDRKYVMVKHK